MLFKFYCGRRCHFLPNSFFSNDLSSILSSGGFVMLLSLTNHLVLSRSCNFFLSYPFSRSVVFSFEFSHLIKFCLLPQPECCLKSFLPLVPFFHQFRRQCVVKFIEYPLILSRSCSILSIFSRSAVQIISFLILLYLVLTGVVSISILSLNHLVLVVSHVLLI